jgi:hypothetical protein
MRCVRDAYWTLILHARPDTTAFKARNEG